MSVAPTRPSTPSYHVFGTGEGGGSLTLRSLLLRVLVAVVTFFGLVVIAVLLVAVSPTLSRSLTAFFIKQQPGALPWNGADPVNIVLVGLDDRPWQRGQFPHTDTIMVASVNPSTNSVHMLSLPRDLWVNIPGVGVDRINDAYGDGGTRLLIQTVEGVVNAPIRYYAILKFTGFQRVIDAVGGVTIDVKRPINDPTFPAPVGYGYAPLHIRAGVQHMNGKLALEYVRTRHDDPLGDLGRNQRQQQLLVALKQQVLRPTTLFKLPMLLGALRQAVSTDFPYTDLTYLGRVVMTAPKSHVRREGLNYANGAVTNFTTAGGADVLQPNWPKIHWIARSLFHDPQLAAARVDVLNGSSITGQASLLGHWMTSCGFRIESVANAPRTNYEYTKVIRNTSVGGGDYVARMAGNLLGKRVISQAVPGASAPVVVIVGRDWTDPAQS